MARPRGAAAIDVLAKRNELDVEMAQFVHHFQEVPDRTCQPIEAPDHQHLEAAATSITQHAIQPGPAGPAAGQLVDVLVDDREATLLRQLQQVVALGFRMLIDAADSQIQCGFQWTRTP